MQKYYFIGILSAAVVLIMTTSCGRTENEPEFNPADSGVIITVSGPIVPDDLGVTLTHEHLLVDFIGADETGYHRWNRDSVAATLLPYLEALETHGVVTFIDPTPAYLGRDPELLKMLSEKSGLHIVTNTGYYGARSNQFIPGEAMDMSAGELADAWIQEFEAGIEGSGVHPGFIKIGVDNAETLSAFHDTLITAAALANKSTGLVIASHTGPDAPAFAQLEVLDRMDVPLSSFIWVHAQSGTEQGNIEAAERGAWISLDGFNAARDETPGSKFSSAWYAERISALKEAGYLNRVLLSHDAGWYRPGEPGGGEIRGYTGIFTHLLPELESQGFTEAEITQLLEKNPGDAFAVRAH